MSVNFNLISSSSSCSKNFIFKEKEKENFNPNISDVASKSFLSLNQTNNKRKGITSTTPFFKQGSLPKPEAKVEKNKRGRVANPESADTIVIPSPTHILSTPKKDQSFTTSPESSNSTSSEEEFEAHGNEMIDQYKLLTSAAKLDTPKIRKAIKKAQGLNRFVMRLEFEGEQVVIKRSGNSIKSFYHFTRQKKLGQGTFGNVISVPEVTQEEDGIKVKRVAVKICRTDYQPDPEKQITELDCENSKIVSKCYIRKGFENLMKLNTDGPQRGIMRKPHFYENEDFYVMDEAICSLEDLIKEEKAFNKDHPLFDKFVFDSIFTDLVEGIRYFCKVGFIHNDIKPANILLFLEEGKVVARIADADGGFFSIDLSRKHYKGSFSTFPSDDLQLILNIVASEKSAEKEKTATENVEQAAVPLSEKESRHLMNIHVRQNVYCLGLTIGKLALKVGIDKYNSFIGKMIHPECFKRPTIEDVSMHLFLNNLCTRVQ